MKTKFGRPFLIISAASLCAGVVELLFFQMPFAYQALLFFITLAFPPLLYYFYSDYAESKRQLEIEEQLPAALFQIASFPKRAPMERMLESVAKSDFGPLSEEFAKALKQIRSGLPVSQALDQLRLRNNSLLLNRAVSLLLSAYKSGADLSQAFKEVAEDVFQLQSLVKERRGALALQKYTLIAASAFLVPAILGLLLNIVSSLQSAFSPETLGMSAVNSAQALLDAVVLGNHVYLGFLAIISSVFIASSEGDIKKSVLYVSALLPVSFLVFSLVRGAGIIG
ncbi:MAG: type II secretion system F family protein [Candidatus Micrarchaeota archaeon]